MVWNPFSKEAREQRRRLRASGKIPRRVQKAFLRALEKRDYTEANNVYQAWEFNIGTHITEKKYSGFRDDLSDELIYLAKKQGHTREELVILKILLNLLKQEEDVEPIIQLGWAVITSQPRRRGAFSTI